MRSTPVGPSPLCVVRMVSVEVDGTYLTLDEVISTIVEIVESAAAAAGREQAADFRGGAGPLFAQLPLAP